MERKNLRYIRFQVELPKKIWISEISRKFPDEIITLDYSNPLSKNERQLFLSTISKNNIFEIYTYLKENKQLKEVEIFGDNIKLIFSLSFLQKLMHQQLTIIFPVTIHNGYAIIEVFAKKSQIELFEKVFNGIKILRISETTTKKSLLTLKQKEILETAYKLGYFSYPRKITLTELAKYLKISKATLSETLRVCENKIISNYFLNS